jgi:two-component system nitrogen regulation response regulator GlnG
MTGSVLVVDDDSAIRTVVAAALRREGHAVTTAASLAELRRAIGMPPCPTCWSPT